MASSPTETRYFESFDGERIAWRELGEGRPVILIHGYFSTAEVNWIKYGHAARIAAAGFRVIMPDLRGHGASTTTHDAGAYTADALTKDGHALVAHLGLSDYDLGGYSLGARTTARMLATGASPARVIFCGMGLEGLTDVHRRSDYFRGVLTNLGQHKRGSPEFMAEAFMKTSGGDPVALLRVLDTFIDTPAEAIAAVTQPALVVMGDEDDEVGDGRALAAALPNGRYHPIPGGHMSAVVKPELGAAIAAFLSEETVR